MFATSLTLGQSAGFVLAGWAVMIFAIIFIVCRKRTTPPERQDTNRERIKRNLMEALSIIAEMQHEDFAQPGELSANAILGQEVIRLIWMLRDVSDPGSPFNTPARIAEQFLVCSEKLRERGEERYAKTVEAMIPAVYLL